MARTLAILVPTLRIAYSLDVWPSAGCVSFSYTTRAGINTDPYGYNIVENPVHIHDLQATILHLLGIDHKRLTFKHQGRWYRLTDVHGEIVRELLS